MKHYTWCLTLALLLLAIPIAYGANCGGGDDNITFASGGKFNVLDDTANCEYIEADNWINVSCGTNSHNYSISSGDNFILNTCTANCVFPYDDYAISGIVKLCKGTYYLNDTADNGILIFNAQNNVLNGDGSVLIGDYQNTNSRGLRVNNHNNTISNITMKEYYSGILNTGNYLKVYDSVFINNSKEAISIVSKNYGDIKNISIKYGLGTYTLEPSGLSLFNSNYTNFTNSIIMNNYRGLKCQIGIYNNVSDNYFSDQNYSGIDLNSCNYTQSINNVIYYSGHNGIELDSYYSTIRGNIIKYYDHNGIDLLGGDLTFAQSGYNVIDNNSISESVTTTSSDGILIENSIKNNVTNNQLINIVGSNNFSGALKSGGNMSFAGGNLFKNNVVINAKYCTYVEANATYQDNYFQNCTAAIAFIKDYNNDITTFDSFANYSNNTLIDTLNIIVIQSQTKDIYFNESASQLKTNLSNGGKVYLYQPGQKDLSISNTTVTVRALSGVEIFNGSQATPVHSDFTGQYNETVTGFTKIFSNQNRPYPTSIATTITDIDFTYLTNTLIYKQTGAGSSSISGIVTYISGKSGYYAVTAYSTFLDNYDDEPYVVADTREYVFTSTTFSNAECNSNIRGILGDFGQIGSLAGLIVLVAIFGVILLYNKGYRIDIKNLNINAKIIILAMMLFGLLLAMLSILANTVC